MSRRIEIELTSTRPDGSWTWRAAGAREPKGVLDGAVLPDGSSVGDVFRAEAEVEIDGITILSVTTNKPKAAKADVLELLPSDKPFQAVTQQLAERRGPRRDGDRPRRDGDRPRRDGDRPRRDGDRPRRDGDRPRRDGGPHQGADRDRDRPRRDRRDSRPHFEVPPELPQRPKPKRLKPGRAHRNAVVAELPEEQRPIAERVLQGGIPAVRQAVQEQNARLRAEGKPEVGAAGLLQMAEQLLPRLRVAEWLDRADAAKRDLDELDLRDLRSVVTAADDPLVARDEHTRELAAELKQALLDKQEREYQNWLSDIDAAVGVGRVIRALKLSGQPPKAGVPFPTDAADRLAAATLAALEPTATSERWSALLEAVAFSPVRTLVVPTTKPEQVTDDLLATVKRIGSLIPQVAELFGVEPKTGGLPPRPLRPTRPNAPAAKKQGAPKPPQQPAPAKAKDSPAKQRPGADPAAPATEPESAAPAAEDAAAPAPEPAHTETPATEAKPSTADPQAPATDASAEARTADPQAPATDAPTKAEVAEQPEAPAEDTAEAPAEPAGATAPAAAAEDTAAARPDPESPAEGAGAEADRLTPEVAAPAADTAVDAAAGGAGAPASETEAPAPEAPAAEAAHATGSGANAEAESAVAE